MIAITMVDCYLDQIENDQDAYASFWEHESVDHRLTCWFVWLGDWNPAPIPLLACDVRDDDDTDYECSDCGYDTRYGHHQRIRGHSWSYPEYYCDGECVEVK